MDKDSLVQRLAWLIAAAMTGTGFYGVYNSRLESKMAWAFIALGIAIASFGYFWPTLQARFSQNFGDGARAVASDFRVWFITVAGVLIYAMGYSIILTVQRDNLADVIQNDIVPFRLALQKWVVPRRLNSEKVEAIASFLQEHRSESINLAINAYDLEAYDFARDLQEAIESGGWRIRSSDYKEHMQPGLRLDVRYPSGANWSDSNDPRNPTAKQILRDALQEAHLRIVGSGSGVGAPELDHVIFTLEIGPRFDGMDAEIQDWPKD